MVQRLGWLRPALPPRPGQETRGPKGVRAHKLSAHPVGGGSGSASEVGTEQPRTSDGSTAEAGGCALGHAPAHGKLVAPLAGTIGVAAILSSARHWGFLCKALAVHSANLAASLATRPLQPLHNRLQHQLAATAAVQEACRQLQVEGLPELQDLMNCIILSEHVYKIVDHSTETSVGFINAIKAKFPPQLVTLQSVCWAQPHVRHRYLLGESADAMYVSFMGTKLPRDMATNANLFQEEVVLDAAMLTSGAASADDIEGSSTGVGTSATAAAIGSRSHLAAHRGFLSRARSVPIHSLYREARSRGKRLVLCGHSLGGAVASLCAVQLLQHLPPNLHRTVSCYGFATPALGNEALAATVKDCGWEARIHNYLSPDDPIPKLLSFRRPPHSAAEKAAPAPGAALPAPAAVAQADGSDAHSAEQRLNSVANDVTLHGSSSSSMEAGQESNAVVAPPGLTGSLDGSGMPRSSSAPALLVRTGAAAGPADGPPKASAAPSQQRNGRLARAGIAAATSAAVAAAVLGQDVDVAAATSAAIAAAMLRQESAPTHLQSAGRGHSGSEDDASDGSIHKPSRHYWLGQRLVAAAAPPLRAAAQRVGSAALAAATPPVRAVVERAGSAARLVALPLSAAASVPMRAAPQYLPLGRQLYITPVAVSAAKPPTDAFDALPSPATSVLPMLAQQPQQQQRAWPFWGPTTATTAAAAAASRPGAATDSLASSLDDDDNVDVAAAAALGDPAAVAAVAATADAQEGSSSSGAAGKKRRRGSLFESHRMATYRHRLLAICQGSLEGRLLLRSLPMLPNLPRPGDVAASELLAPAMFPLRAVGTVTQPAPAAAGDATVIPAAAAAKPAGERPQKQKQQQGRRPFWQRLLARAARQQRQEPPIELLIRVEGRGLANVTQAWIEGILPAPAAAANGEGSNGSKPPATVAEVTILQQPRTPLLPPLERPPLPWVGQISAFASWLAVTLGWVALLRQLQPASSADFLLARVCLPASAVRNAQKAAQNSLLTSVTDGPLLHSLHLVPRLSLHLQSDFAVHSLPLDIRMAADLQSQAHRWPWPWRQRQRVPRAQQQAREQAQQELRADRWWEWPSGSPAAGH